MFDTDMKAQLLTPPLAEIYREPDFTIYITIACSLYPNYPEIGGLRVGQNRGVFRFFGKFLVFARRLCLSAIFRLYVDCTWRGQNAYK